jgi:uncharacterized protein YggE
METKPDTIKISASHQEELFSTHADLYVTVRGASVVGGDQALKKAKEVSQLIDDLAAAGFPSEKVFLQGMYFETSSGALLKSSSAVYRLRLRCDKLDEVPALLDVIAARKNAVLENIDWKYPEEEAREKALDTALARAQARAQKVAAALGVKLLGVYDLIESNYDEEPPMYRAAMRMKVGESLEERSLDMDIQHTRTIHVNVEVWYRVSAFE